MYGKSDYQGAIKQFDRAIKDSPGYWGGLLRRRAPRTFIRQDTDATGERQRCGKSI